MAKSLDFIGGTLAVWEDLRVGKGMGGPPGHPVSISTLIPQYIERLEIFSPATSRDITSIFVNHSEL